MAASNAERQRQYRQRQKAGYGERLNMAVNLNAKRGIERLARRYGVTQRAMLESLISDADKAADLELTKTGTSDELRTYYDGA